MAHRVLLYSYSVNGQLVKSGRWNVDAVYFFLSMTLCARGVGLTRVKGDLSDK